MATDRPERERRFPTLDEIRAKAERGVVDDSLATEVALNLEDRDILGEPSPDDTAASDSIDPSAEPGGDPRWQTDAST